VGEYHCSSFPIEISLQNEPFFALTNFAVNKYVSLANLQNIRHEVVRNKIIEAQCNLYVLLKLKLITDSNEERFY